MTRANAIPGGNAMPMDRAKAAAQAAARAANGSTGNNGDAQYTVEGGTGAAPDAEASGTSIFDPVLCELVYRWFSAPGAVVLDPFAGGSVRGIVAHRLGRAYVGHELRAEQVEANRAQAERICADAPAPAPRPPRPEGVRVRVSSKMANLKFNGCDPEYIRTTCHASCCQSSKAPSGTIISILPHEIGAMQARGAQVVDGLLQSPGKRCPFKTEVDLCGLHFTPDKPFGCIASPFTLNDSDTLIVRNRYRLLKCYDDGARLPAYVAFRASLNLLFGEPEAQRLCDHLAAGGGDLDMMMTQQHHDWLRANDETKAGLGAGEIPAPPPPAPDGPTPLPRWITGDSREIDRTCADVHADLVFTCPPYADLERYSDDPADLSTMAYPEFRAAYAEIIRKACARLRPDSFACFVVGEVRDKKGAYLNFVGDTVAAFRDAGLAFYNEAILVTAAGSLPIRAGKQFSVSRKLGKTHQNVLVFVKGDGARAARRCGPVEVDSSLLEQQEEAQDGPL